MHALSYWLGLLVAFCPYCLALSFAPSIEELQAQAWREHAGDVLVDCANFCEGGMRLTSCQTGCTCPVCREAGEGSVDQTTGNNSWTVRLSKSGYTQGWQVNTNSVYRLSDLVLQTKGSNWRHDSTTILCDPKYRGSLLRELLQNTASLPGRQLSSENDSSVETAVRSLEEGGHGYACLTGIRGPSGLQLQPAAAQLAELSKLVRDRLWRRSCRPASRHELVVNLLQGGNAVPNVQRVIQLVDAALKRDAKLPAKLSAKIKRIIINGAVGSGPGAQQTAEALRHIRRFYRLVGLDVRVRSTLDVDEDLCYVACTPKLILAAGSYAKLVQGVRSGACASREILLTIVDEL